MQPRSSARAVGLLFLSAFLLYGLGSSLALSQSDGALHALGVALMLLNTVAVVAIGILVIPVLRPHSRRVPATYLGTRILEGALLAVGAIALLAGANDTNDVFYNLAMATLGIGSIFFCMVLFSARLVPRLIAGWGIGGYAVFATGSILELAGVTGAGIVGAIPGGLFEITFAIWIIAKGFRQAQPGTGIDPHGTERHEPSQVARD